MDVKVTQADFLRKVLDAARLRHQAIAQNVANVNTPGYQRLEVSFEEGLAHALAHGDAESLTRLQPRLQVAEGEPARADGNSVDIDQELGRLTNNTLLYNIVTQVLASQMAQMRSAISGR
jgi:flagellar basal-body rod protein FlgB